MLPAVGCEVKQHVAVVYLDCSVSLKILALLGRPRRVQWLSQKQWHHCSASEILQNLTGLLVCGTADAGCESAPLWLWRSG